MLDIAKNKISDEKVEFLKADITQEWNFTSGSFDLVVCSLVLEHIENLDSLFSRIADRLHPGGTLYIGELHPFKQYTGSKARYETEEGTQIVSCYVHPISEFTNLAKKYGLTIDAIQEYFDEEDKTSIPRILTLKFKK